MNAATPPTGLPLEEVLLRCLQRTDEWVRFAEAKNAILIGLTSTWSVGLLAALATDLGETGVGVAIVIGLVFVVSGGLRSAASLVPVLSGRSFRGRPEAIRIDEANLFFFGDVARIPKEQVCMAYIGRYAGGREADRLHIDLTGQIWINSRIALDKFTAFSEGATLTFSGLTLTAFISAATWISGVIP